MTCVTCKRTFPDATRRHKCPHGIWCGIPGREQLDYRSRTCDACNILIRSSKKAEESPKK